VREPQKIIKKINKDNNVIFHVFVGAEPIGGLMKLGTFVDVPDVMNYAYFHLRVMSSLGAGGGSKRGFCL
jgi:hypothetical protein